MYVLFQYVCKIIKIINNNLLKKFTFEYSVRAFEDQEKDEIKYYKIFILKPIVGNSQMCNICLKHTQNIKYR